jgi:hypothetical protein
MTLAVWVERLRELRDLELARVAIEAQLMRPEAARALRALANAVDRDIRWTRLGMNVADPSLVERAAAIVNAEASAAPRLDPGPTTPDHPAQLPFVVH